MWLSKTKAGKENENENDESTGQKFEVLRNGAGYLRSGALACRCPGSKGRRRSQIDSATAHRTRCRRGGRQTRRHGCDVLSEVQRHLGHSCGATHQDWSKS